MTTLQIHSCLLLSVGVYVAMHVKILAVIILCRQYWILCGVGQELAINVGKICMA